MFVLTADSMIAQKSNSQEPVSVSIRPILPEEISEAMALVHQSIREINAQDYSPRQIEAIVRSYHRSTFRNKNVLVAEHQSRIVGVAKTSFILLGSQSIEADLVHPRLTGMGIGRELVTALEGRAKHRNVQKLSVFSSLTAANFYQKLDYQQLGKGKILEDIDCIVMEKQFRHSTAFEQFLGVVFLLCLCAFIFFALYALVYLGVLHIFSL